MAASSSSAVPRWSSTRVLVLRLVGLTYMFAYASLFTQLDGLFSCNGVNPLEKPKLTDGMRGFLSQPSIFYLTDMIPIPAQYDRLAVEMSVVCALGSLIGLGVFLNVLSDFISFFFLYAGYLSIMGLRTPFMSFQWDVMLLEVGFMCVLLAGNPSVCFSAKSKKIQPTIPSPGEVQKPQDGPLMSHELCRKLMRWLLFRLMISSAVVKLYSRCPVWWDFTALKWHLQSQCLPMPLAWFAFQLPDVVLKLGVAITLFAQGIVSFALLLPFAPIRNVAVAMHAFLMILISATGNYNFFNFLTLVLCVACLDDEVVHAVLPRGLNMLLSFSVVKTTGPKKQQDEQLKWWSSLGVKLRFATYVVIIVILIGLFACFFPLSSISSGKPIFSLSQLRQNVIYLIPISVAVALVDAVICFSRGLLRDVHRYGIFSVTSFASAATGMVYIFLLMSSITPFYNALEISPNRHRARTAGLVSHVTNMVHPPAEFLSQLSAATKPFYLSNSYGLFRRMTGVYGRPELTIEGYDAHTGTWLEYDFKYKPNREEQRPLSAAPSQPRLDWQMWFAALGRYEEQGWLVHLVYKLLNNDVHTSKLLNGNPFLHKSHSVNTVESSWPLASRVWNLGASALGAKTTLRDNSGHSLPENRKQERRPSVIRIIHWNFTFTDDFRSHEWWRRSHPTEWFPETNVTTLSRVAQKMGWPTLNAENGDSIPSPCPKNPLAELPVLEILAAFALLAIQHKVTSAKRQR